MLILVGKSEEMTNVRSRCSVCWEVKHARNKWSSERCIRVQREMLPIMKPGGLPRTQTVVPKYLFPRADSRTRLGKIQPKPGTSCGAKSKERLKV